MLSVARSGRQQVVRDRTGGRSGAYRPAAVASVGARRDLGQTRTYTRVRRDLTAVAAVWGTVTRGRTRLVRQRRTHIAPPSDRRAALRLSFSAFARMTTDKQAQRPMIRNQSPRFRSPSVLLGALALTACGVSKVRGRDLAPAAGEWTAVRCASCSSAGVSVDARRSVDERGRPGQHAVARVRNLNPRRIALTVEVAAAELPDSELYVPSERWRVVLGPSGEPRGEAMLVLRHTAATSASVHGVEGLE